MSPGIFKSKDAEPEATLEAFSDYCETMERVFRLTRRIHPTTGAKIEYDDAEKKDLILVEGGEDMQDLFRHVGLVEDGDTYAGAVEKVKTALRKRGNRTAAVFKLFNGHAQGSQSFESWHRGVHKAAKLIDWTGYDADKAAVDAIITQTSSTKLQQKGLQENPAYLELVDIGISQEQAKKKSNKLPDGESETVSRLKQENKSLKKRLSGGGDSGGGKVTKKCDRCCSGRCKGGSSCFAEGKTCLRCQGQGHFAASSLCPDKDSHKKEGGKKDKGKGKTTTTTTRRVEKEEDSLSDGSEESLGCGRICTGSGEVPVARVGRESQNSKSIFCKLKVSGLEKQQLKRLEFATDTGVKKTILNRSDWEKIRESCHMSKTKVRFRPYGTRATLPIIGRAKVEMKARAGAKIDTYVYVNDDDKDSSLLGEDDAKRLGIVKINLNGAAHEVVQDEAEFESETEIARRIKQNKLSELSKGEQETEQQREEQNKSMEKLAKEYKDIFGGVGKYDGPEIKIQLKDNIRPVIQAPRRIPLHYTQPLEDHLKELLAEDVIEGPLVEEEEGSWISNLVITDKKWDGPDARAGDRIQIRANLDCRPLNEHCYQTHEPIPTTEELRHKLRGSDTFSTVDMVHSFHQFVLEPEARKLFTFRGPGGLYRYKRLVMGNSPASSEAHKRVKMVVAGCEGVCQIKDDILVYGSGAEHDQRLRQVLERFREAGLTLRREKCYLGKKEVKWFGMIYNKFGMSSDPEKVAVIRDWPAPRTVRDVKSFLQTVQFNAVYMAAELEGEMNYPELTAPLRLLTRRKTKFSWTEVHQRHFQLIKERLCSDRVMVPFDPARATRLYSDGGPEGGQATVAQEYQHEVEGTQWRPVAHTARAWTAAEKGYSQIEKESNALLTGMISNRMYLLGIPFVAVVDHKPLLPLYNTPKRPKQMRVDRHRMKLMAFDFKVIHMSGDKIPCDYGSRRGCPRKMFSKEEEEAWGVEDDTEIYVNRVVEEMLPVAVTREMVKEATAKDTTLMMIMEDLSKGVCRKSLTRYTQVFEELTVVDGMVVRGDRLVIPAELQAMVVQLAHETHQGFDKTLSLLRESNWFPGMSDMVRQYVETCFACQVSEPRTGQEPLKPNLLPERPWQHLHADFKGPIGKSYYLHTIIDQYSKFPVVEVCKSTNWESMEPMLETALDMIGNVDRLTTDGGPPYDSRAFKKFMKERGVTHHICTAENPQANGFVEVFNKVLVKMIHTAVTEHKDPRKVVQKYLASYRATPHKTTGKSPYELLFNRKMQTKLPSLIGINKEVDQAVRVKHDAEKERQKRYADKKRRAKEKQIQMGDEILIQQKKSTLKTPWDPKPYKVVAIHGSKVVGQRGEEVKARAKNNIKVVKKRPACLQVREGRKHYYKEKEEPDIDISLDKIRVLSVPRVQMQEHPQHGEEQVQEQQEEGAAQQDEEELQQEEEIGQVGRPQRKRKKVIKYDAELEKKNSPGPRARKRAQAAAKYRKEETCRTVMKIKERWELREKVQEAE